MEASTHEVCFQTLYFHFTQAWHKTKSTKSFYIPEQIAFVERIAKCKNVTTSYRCLTQRAAHQEQERRKPFLLAARSIPEVFYGHWELHLWAEVSPHNLAIAWLTTDSAAKLIFSASVAGCGLSACQCGRFAISRVAKSFKYSFNSCFDWLMNRYSHSNSQSTHSMIG